MSLTAYGVVAFLSSGNNTCFVIVKSRVAPLIPLTLPKLELMGALTALVVKYCLEICRHLAPPGCFLLFQAIVAGLRQTEVHPNLNTSVIRD